MKERPILFSGPMVRAILDGSKTQTRRLVKPQDVVEWPTDFDPEPYLHSTKCPGLCDYGCDAHPCPYGVPGDRLWVRETLRNAPDGWTYAADGSPVVLYEDSPHLGAMSAWAHHKESDVCVSIHMPRWASRLTLEVTSVRVERLHDITDEDAKAEGVAPLAYVGDNQPIAGDMFTGRSGPHMVAFASLWESINGVGSWVANPWVWVVGFKRRDGEL